MSYILLVFECMLRMGIFLLVNNHFSLSKMDMYKITLFYQKEMHIHKKLTLLSLIKHKH